MEAEVKETSKMCPNCSTTFACYSGGCWCSELPQIMPMNPEHECYCPECLKAIIDNKIKEHNKA